MGSSLPDPTAFDGGVRPTSVLSGSRFMDNNSFAGHYGVYVSPEQRLMLTVAAGSNHYSADLDFSFLQEDIPGYFSAYVNQTRSLSSSFVEGERTVSLRRADGLPWFYRDSLGFGYTTDPGEPLILSTAVVYQQVGVHSGPFEGEAAPFDTRRNPLLVSRGRMDEIFSVRLAGRYADLDNNAVPGAGSKVGFFFDQAIPMGRAQISSTRMGFNFTQWAALGQRDTLIFQFQGATSFGLLAPYEAYNLGGPYSIRGFQFGELGGGTSFLQSTLELRHSLGSLEIFGSDIPLRLTAFADYGSALGTAGQVFGRPAIVGSKPDGGFGFGLGVTAQTNFGLLRLEAGLSPSQSPVIYFNLGDRF